MTETTPIKRRPGRPRKYPMEESPIEREPIKTKKINMKATPNWETADPNPDENPDRLHIPNELIPEGMSLQWITTSVRGQDFSRHRAGFERRGWTPVHQSDFDGQLDGLFMQKGAQGEVTMGEMVLMARPKAMTEKAHKADKIRAQQQVAIKEQAWTQGDIPGVSMDARHESALRTNKIRKSIEQIDIPD